MQGWIKMNQRVLSDMFGPQWAPAPMCSSQQAPAYGAVPIPSPVLFFAAGVALAPSPTSSLSRVLGHHALFWAPMNSV